MNTERTPGPWRVEFNYEGQHRYCPFIQVGPARISFTQGYELATDAARKAEAEANARLIAAAPDLLEALEMGPSILHELPDGKECSCSQCHFVRAKRAAIAKATGSPS